MIESYKLINNKLEKSSIMEKDNWIHLTNPSIEEIKLVVDELDVLEDFLIAALDREEVSRLEIDDEQILILSNASFKEDSESSHLRYSTVPLSIIIIDDHLITVSLQDLHFINKFKLNQIKTFNPAKRVRSTLQIVYQLASQYLIDLRIIDKFTTQMEKNLETDMRNEYLLHLLSLEKNLVYFTSSLKGNQAVIRKIARSISIRTYEEDEDLLEDVLIELEQASEMTQVNSMIIRSIRDAFSSIISNSLNDTMKILASLTIILTIPTIIFSFYGMNTNFGHPIQNNLFIPYVIAFVAIIFTWILYKIMKSKNMF